MHMRLFTFKQKIVTGIAAASMIAASLVATPSAFANGSMWSWNSWNNLHRTNNRVNIDLTKTTDINQSNNTTIHNDVDIKQNTGGNSISDSWHLPTSIKSGNASAEVLITNQGSSNIAEIQGCGCFEIGNFVINAMNHKPTRGSNSFTLKVSDTNTIDQSNWLHISNDVDVHQNTGNNRIRDNWDPSIISGMADAMVDIHNVGGLNMLHLTP